MRRIVLVSLVVSSLGWAQTEPKPTASQPKPQTITFDTDDLIEGGLARGLGDIYLVPPNPKFPSLIRVRMNFDDKLRESVHEM
jgi:hypothetical protein